ncbi:MAG: Lactate utilization protein A [Calditrichaeota bacterium]|nr:Lactate utilization protein A [Calditrichota bacterium]
MASPTVSLFIPCFVDQLFPETGVAVAEVLRRVGCTVRYPREQTCCGQPSFNSGFAREALPLAERFIRVFGDADAVVVPSGSCLAMVKQHYGELALPERVRGDWEALRGRVFELSQFLVDELGIRDAGGRWRGRVAWHTSCHGYREMGIDGQPLALLRNVAGLELVELDDRKLCCGFGGTFAAKFSALSAAIGEDKLAAIERTGASTVTATDDSCLMHIAGMLSRRDIAVKTVHYARILAGG